jgi:hypothetical protein
VAGNGDLRDYSRESPYIPKSLPPGLGRRLGPALGTAIDAFTTPSSEEYAVFISSVGAAETSISAVRRRSYIRWSGVGPLDATVLDAVLYECERLRVAGERSITDYRSPLSGGKREHLTQLDWKSDLDLEDCH